jgi:flagellar protein FlaG
MNIQPAGAPIVMRAEERQPQAIGQKDGVLAVNGATPAAASADPSRKDLTDAVDKINGSPLGAAQGLEFSIDEDTKGIVVKVIDLDTKEVLRQMPSKVALEIAKSIDKTRGLLIDQTA